MVVKSDWVCISCILISLLGVDNKSQQRPASHNNVQQSQSFIYIWMTSQYINVSKLLHLPAQEAAGMCHVASFGISTPSRKLSSSAQYDPIVRPNHKLIVDAYIRYAYKRQKEQPWCIHLFCAGCIPESQYGCSTDDDCCCGTYCDQYQVCR